MAIGLGWGVPPSSTARAADWGPPPSTSESDPPATAQPKAGSTEPAPTSGQPASQSESPRVLFERGRKAYRVGDFDAAVKSWERAYALSEKPLLLYNISLAYKGRYEITQDVADLRRARAVLDNFIKLAQADPDLELDDAPERMAELEQLIERAEQEAEQDQPAITPVPRPQPRPEPRPIVPEGPDPGRDYRIGGIASMAGGGALMLAAGGLAVFYAIRSQELSADLRSQLQRQEELNCLNLPTPTAECMELQSQIDTTRSDGRQSNRNGYISVAVTGGLGLVGVVAGVVVFTEGNRRSRRWEKGLGRIKISPWGRGLAVHGRF